MSFVVKSDVLIDGTGRKPIENAAVLIEGQRIKTVGNEGDIDIPTKSSVIDLGKQTITPGFVDAHSHMASTRRNLAQIKKAFWQARNLHWDLQNGTTTLCLPGEHNFEDIMVREAEREGIIRAPRILTACRAIKSAHGHGWMGTVFVGADEIRGAIRENFHMGADFTKLFVTGGVSDVESSMTHCYLSRDEIEAAIEETHRVEKKIAAHCHGGIGAQWCIEGGLDSIEHGVHLSEDQVKLMVEKGTYWNATLPQGFHPKEQERGYMNNAPSRKKWLEAVESFNSIFPFGLRAGVKYIVSTDGRHGTLPFCVDTLVKKFGVSNMDALLAVTRNAADCCGILNDVGTIEPGKYADIAAFNGNPLDEVESVYNVGFVMKGGKRIEEIMPEEESYYPA